MTCPHIKSFLKPVAAPTRQSTRATKKLDYNELNGVKEEEKMLDSFHGVMLASKYDGS